jgi:hypothetical protein
MIKDLNYYKENCAENYITTPISVLRYITELENKIEETINSARCCKNVKEKYTPTFEVNLNSKQAQKDRCDQMTKILTAPSKVYYFNGTNYIEIEP